MSPGTLKLRIWSHLLKRSVMKNLIFCAVKPISYKVHLHISFTATYLGDPFILSYKTSSKLTKDQIYSHRYAPLLYCRRTFLWGKELV